MCPEKVQYRKPNSQSGILFTCPVSVSSTARKLSGSSLICSNDLPGPPTSNRYFPLAKKITFLRVLQCVVSPDLICKESFPDCTGFRLAAKISRTVVPVNGKR